MQLFVLGTSHAVAPSTVRTRMHVPLEEVRTAVAFLRERGVLAGAVPLSTCGRLELYGSADDPARVAVLVTRMMAGLTGVTPEELRAHAYLLREGEAVRHLLRVASGLDSVVLGEAEILGQVRVAARDPRFATTGEPVLRRLFQQALTAGKRVRSETALGRGAASFAGAALAVLRDEVGTIEGLSAVVLGAGQNGTSVAKVLAKAGAGRLVVLNRTVERAYRVALEVGGEAGGLGALESALAHADVVVSCAPGAARGLTANMMRPLKARPTPAILLDLAHPRSIDPALAGVAGVRLLDLDEVFRRVESGRRARAAAVPEAEAVVEEEAVAFERWRRARARVASGRPAHRNGAQHRASPAPARDTAAPSWDGEESSRRSVAP